MIGNISEKKRHRDWLLGIFLVAATLIAYAHCWRAGFIWDDDRHLTDNPVIVGPLGLKEIWTTSAARICPLTLTTFWFEHLVWGLDPLPYHLTNVIVHAGCGLVLWRLLFNLRIPGAWWGATLWVLHPVQVETVAWVTELKNTQSCLFYLLSIFCFAKGKLAVRSTSTQTNLLVYLLAVFFAALAMASKSSTVILPLVWALSAWWIDRKWEWRSLGAILPVFLLSVAMSMLSIWTQSLEGANEGQWLLTWPQRLCIAGKAFWFYLGKLIWPYPLIFIYPRWNMDHLTAASYTPIVLLIVSFVLLWRHRRVAGPIFVTFTYFLAALLPVLGLLNHYFLRYSFVGDHFQYLASIGPLALTAASISQVGQILKIRNSVLNTLIGAPVLLLFGLLTWLQTCHYASDRILWAATSQKNSQSWIVENNLGIALVDAGDFDHAIYHYQRAIDLNPRFSSSYGNLGVALMNQERIDDAIGWFQKALSIDPIDSETHNNLGNAYRKKGMLQEASEQYKMSVALQPADFEAHYNFAGTLFRLGQLEEAVAEYKISVQIAPHSDEAHYNFGVALMRLRRLDEAVSQFESVLQINAYHYSAHENLGAILLKRGQFDEALRHFEMAAKAEPANPDAHVNLAAVLMQERRLDEAIQEYKRALILRPEDEDTARRLSSARYQQHLLQ